MPVSSGFAGSSAGCGVASASVGGLLVSSSGRASTISVSLEPSSSLSFSLVADSSSALASSHTCSAASPFSGAGLSDSAAGPSSETPVSISKVS